MKLIFSGAVFVCLVLAMTSWAQESSAPTPKTSPAQAVSGLAEGSAQSNPSSGVSELPSGTVMLAELSRSLDAKRAKVDDRIEAKTSMDVLSHGRIIVPRNARIIGHVTEAKAHSKQSPGSVLGIEFDRVRLKNGRELPLRAKVQAIGRPLKFSANGTVWESHGGDPYDTLPAGMPSAPRSQRSVAEAPSMAGPLPGPSGNLGSSREPRSVPDETTVGALGPASRGVIGIQGLSLKSSAPASVLSADDANVHLDGGTQLVLRVP